MSVIGNKTFHMGMDEKFSVTLVSTRATSSLANSLVMGDTCVTKVDPTKANGFEVINMARESSLAGMVRSMKASFKLIRNMAKVVSTS